MSSTTRTDPMSRFEGQQSECDHTVTLRNSDLMATTKEFIIPGCRLPILFGYRPGL
jgi:hypothetical protein